MLRALETIATGGSSGRVVTGRTAPAPRTAFLFPGQGSQRTGAGARLYRAEPVFADALDDVLTHLAPHLDLPLRDIMFAEPGTERAALLHRTRCTQPALFALAVALFRLMDHRGVRPGLLIGHSVGGLAAAHAAGVLDLPGACALVAARGRLMDALPGGGAMAAVEADEDEIRAALAEGAAPHGDISVAAVNGPRSTVVSGDRAPVLRLAAAFRAQGRRTRELTVSHAFHSAHMDPMLDDFRRVAEGLTYSAPRIPVLSDLTGERATADELCDPGTGYATPAAPSASSTASAACSRRASPTVLNSAPAVCSPASYRTACRTPAPAPAPTRTPACPRARRGIPPPTAAPSPCSVTDAPRTWRSSKRWPGCTSGASP
ncbi:acyltransferase domain-containing protein [Streptomyces clavuligerus]|uniref:acyltransferase domain-containing protein n=1 Tax=Streptomyces clavuligerus TaxID=1901 RepID=UPI0039C69FDB